MSLSKDAIETIKSYDTNDPAPEGSLHPILEITTTINQLMTTMERNERNYCKLAGFNGLSKTYFNRAKIKRNFKFTKYYHKKAILHLYNYRELLIKIEEKKKVLLLK